MVAVMVPATAFSSASVGSSWLIAGLFFAVLLLANLPAHVPVRRMVYAGMAAAALGMTAMIMVPCYYWWFC